MMTSFSEFGRATIRFRSRADIMTALLQSATGGVNKTKLVYMAYLSYTQLKEYLLILEDGGLLAYDQPTMTYRTTTKGTQFLSMNEKLNKLSGFAVVDGILVSDRKEDNIGGQRTQQPQELIKTRANKITKS